MTNQINENLGPAERIIQMLTTHSDHLVHNRPGMVVEKSSAPHGVEWIPGALVDEDGKKVFLRYDKVGKKTQKTKVGSLWADGTIRGDDRRKIGRFQAPGILTEVAVWMYNQVAEVWKLDNEFAARWASYAFRREDTPRDLLVVLGAFMLVQSRFGEPILGDDGKAELYDEDYRDVGEAMCLTYDRKSKGFDSKQLLRVRNLLALPEIAEINRELGFGRSARRPTMGRWTKAAERWLRYREVNPPLLAGLIRSGNRNNVKRLCRHVGYKPLSAKFFEDLRWRQTQSGEGHREILDANIQTADSWEGLSESDICSKIVQDRLNFKQVVGRIPSSLGLTRAIMAASIDAGGLSNKDLVSYTPTLEELGLLEVQSIKEKWEAALQAASDQRARHVAQRVSNQQTKEKLETSADQAVTKAVAEAVRGIRLYVVVDISAPMTSAIEAAKTYITTILAGFPLEKLHVSVFNTMARIVNIQTSSRAGVTAAFRGIRAGGGTNYGTGTLIFQREGLLPKDDEDVIILYIGDEEQRVNFHREVAASGLRPAAFGLIRLYQPYYGGAFGRDQHLQQFKVVRDTATELGIPCFNISEETFKDAYAVPQILRNLMESTPVGQTPGRESPRRVSLVQAILNTELLQKPAWAYTQV